jgi:hypothetical protein
MHESEALQVPCYQGHSSFPLQYIYISSFVDVISLKALTIKECVFTNFAKVGGHLLGTKKVVQRLSALIIVIHDVDAGRRCCKSTSSVEKN